MTSNVLFNKGDNVLFGKNAEFVPAPPVGSFDPYWDNVSLLLPFEGTSGATTTTDLSTNNTTVTFYGGAQISDGQSKFGSTSLYLNGSDAYIRADDALNGLTTADSFTLELWVYPTRINILSELFIGINRLSDGNNRIVLGWSGSGPMYINGSNVGTDAGDLFTTNEWQHIAYNYNASTGDHTYYRNGKPIWKYNAVLTVDPQDCTLAIGAEFDAANGGTPGNYIQAYISDLRVTRNVARYNMELVTGGPYLTVETSDAGATGTGAVMSWLGCGLPPEAGNYGVIDIKHNTFDNRLYYVVAYSIAAGFSPSVGIFYGGWEAPILDTGSLNYNTGCSPARAVYRSSGTYLPEEIPQFTVSSTGIINYKQLTVELPPTEAFPTQ